MKTKFLRWGLLLFVFLIPFGTKKFLFDFPMPFRNAYTSEYTSAFLYGSDIIFLVCLLLLLFSKPLSWWNEQLGKLKTPLLFLGVFILISAISVLSAGYPSFSIYSFGRLVLGILSALMIGAALKSGIIRLKEVAVVISLAAVFEAIIGFLQFIFQKSVGLRLLGETVFGPGTPGVAKVFINGTEFARAYGTMPHANILAGFLVLGLLALFYLFIREEKSHWRILEAGGIFVVLTGLFLTFSRSGWITALVSCSFLIVWELFADKERRIKVVHLLLVLLVSCLSLFLVFGWAVSSRAHLSSNEAPVADRWTYDKMGTELILSNPLGVGIGNELFYAYHNGFFEKYNVNALGQWQPIHNLYLMVGSEIGILGLVVFLVFIGWLLISNFSDRVASPRQSRDKFLISNQFPISKLQNITPVVMLISLLVFGLFDHFLWDLELGRLMLWVTIGVLLGVSVRQEER